MYQIRLVMIYSFSAFRFPGSQAPRPGGQGAYSCVCTINVPYLTRDPDTPCLFGVFVVLVCSLPSLSGMVRGYKKQPSYAFLSSDEVS